LDARFVQDVTIFDGTELAPGTQFTKIWRLRNSGTFSWPKSTQLVHVGGDELGSVFAVTVEVCYIVFLDFLMFCLLNCT
jgi:next-to-BRCA1 protein 1